MLQVLNITKNVNTGVSSEGEKSAAVVEDVEEGREAEATETVTVVRGLGTARRSIRAGTVRGRATRNPPTPIVWDEDPPSASIARGKHYQTTKYVVVEEVCHFCYFRQTWTGFLFLVRGVKTIFLHQDASTGNSRKTGNYAGLFITG